jgi:hypothetical protein
MIGRVIRHAAGMIHLLRPSPGDPLNASSAVIHSGEAPQILEALMPYLNMERPHPA